MFNIEIPEYFSSIYDAQKSYEIFPRGVRYILNTGMT